MSAFEKAWAAMLGDSTLIRKFTNPYGTPRMPLETFIDFYPELLTPTIEDMMPYMENMGRDEPVRIDMMPHHQPLAPMSDEEMREIYRTGVFPEPIRPSGWKFSGYGDPQFRTLVDRKDGKIVNIDPPPIGDIENVSFRTDLQQSGPAALFNVANYSNVLKPTSYQKVDGRYVETPISELKYPRRLGETIQFEGQQFTNAQDLIDYLLNTEGEEEWSDMKREQNKDLPFGGFMSGHDTRSGRRAAKKTDRFQRRNE